MKFSVQVLVLLAFSPATFAADVVVPVSSVENSVNIRMEADATTEIVGKLRQGDSLPLQRTIEGWHEVQLADDAYGYISADWADVITAEEFAAREVDAATNEKSSTVIANAESETVEDADAEKDIVVNSEQEALAGTEVETEVVAEGEPEEAVDAEIASEVADDVEIEVAPELVAEVDTAEVEEAAAAAEPVAEEAAEADIVEVDVADSTPTVAVVPVISASSSGSNGLAGPAGPQGPPGPPGSPGMSTIEGTQDFLMKFTDETEGGNSQVFDDGRNVGIGTTNPKQRLEINGNLQLHEQNSSVVGLMLTQSSGGTGYIMHNRADTLTLGAGSVDRMTIDREGYVGIGTARPSHPLEMASGAYVSAGGVWTNSSSRDKKDNIVALTPEEALAALVALEPVRFNYKQDEAEEYVGFIAEDVPGLVASKDRASLSTMDIVAVLTRVVQEQQQKIAELEARLDAAAR